MQHPSFEWLRPLSALIAKVDGQLDDPESSEDAMTESVREIHTLLLSRQYLAQLQKLPDLIVAHGELRSELRPSAA